MKLFKIRFTAWRDQGVAPRANEIQERHDEFSTRMHLLAATAARIKHKHADGNAKEDEKSLAGIAADQKSLEAERMALLSAEKAPDTAETSAAVVHKKVGTFGYQVLNDAGTEVVKTVDEFGNDLPATAVYAFEVVDTDPPLPGWAKGKART